MDDLISRQEAIESLVEKGQCSTRYRLGENWELNGSEIREVIKSLPSAQPEPQWIPCSERSPDVGQRVLLSVHRIIFIGMLHSFGKYLLEPTGISYVCPKDEIDAWMPLPKPYEETERRTDG